jgi:hypothetical protein
MHAPTTQSQFLSRWHEFKRQVAFREAWILAVMQYRNQRPASSSKRPCPALYGLPRPVLEMKPQ